MTSLKCLFLFLFSFANLSCEKIPYDSSNNDRDPEQEYVYSPPVLTGDGWQTGSLSDVGIAQEQIVLAVRRIQNNMYRRVHSILIARHGKLVLEEYFKGYVYINPATLGPYIQFHRDTLHNLASATKSITSILTGLAIENGFIHGEQDSVYSFFPEYKNTSDPLKERMTLEHLLTMTSGWRWNENTQMVEENDLYLFNTNLDPIRFLLSRDIEHEPGTFWNYNGAGVTLLGKIIERESGLNLKAFSEQYLFSPLGITKFKWVNIRYDMVAAHGDMRLRPRDMAKIGQMLLDGGVWNGKRIVSEEWIQKSTRLFCTVGGWEEGGYGYGYLWWRARYGLGGNHCESFCARGWGGQSIIVFPELDLVVVFTGGNYDSSVPVNDIVNNHIMPAVF